MKHPFNVGGLSLDRPFRLQRLGHIGLTQADAAGCDAFYRDELGFRSTDHLQLPGMPAPIGFFCGVGTDHHTLANLADLVEGDNPNYAMWPMRAIAREERSREHCATRHRQAIRRIRRRQRYRS